MLLLRLRLLILDPLVLILICVRVYRHCVLLPQEDGFPTDYRLESRGHRAWWTGFDSIAHLASADKDKRRVRFPQNFFVFSFSITSISYPNFPTFLFLHHPLLFLLQLLFVTSTSVQSPKSHPLPPFTLTSCFDFPSKQC